MSIQVKALSKHYGTQKPGDHSLGRLKGDSIYGFLCSVMFR
jgi:hypothetical protein